MSLDWNLEFHPELSLEARFATEQQAKLAAEIVTSLPALGERKLEDVFEISQNSPLQKLLQLLRSIKIQAQGKILKVKVKGPAGLSPEQIFEIFALSKRKPLGP